MMSGRSDEFENSAKIAAKIPTREDIRIW